MCKSHKLHDFQTLVTHPVSKRFSSSKTMFPIGLTEVTTVLMARPGSRIQGGDKCGSHSPQYFPQAVGVVKIVSKEAIPRRLYRPLQAIQSGSSSSKTPCEPGRSARFAAWR